MAKRNEIIGYSVRTARRIRNRSGGVQTTEFSESLKLGGGRSTPLYLFTLTGTIASGTGVATIRNLADTSEIATSQNVKDPLGHFDGLTSGYRGFCTKQGSDYYALGPYVTKVRWADPVVEYSRNNSTTWINIDTAEDCTGIPEIDGGTP